MPARSCMKSATCSAFRIPTMIQPIQPGQQTTQSCRTTSVLMDGTPGSQIPTYSHFNPSGALKTTQSPAHHPRENPNLDGMMRAESVQAARGRSTFKKSPFQDLRSTISETKFFLQPAPTRSHNEERTSLSLISRNLHTDSKPILLN